MAGHSKWANIKHRKGAQDKKRGKIFTKLIREITIAAKLGGEDPDSNPRLRTAIDKAFAGNMPKDTIQRAIKRGARNDANDNLEEVRYEGYGPCGIAVILDCLTDNKNRTVAEIRHAFTKAGGNLGTEGSVAYLFQQKGIIDISVNGLDENKIMELTIDAGAEDINTIENKYFQVITAPEDLNAIKNKLMNAGLSLEQSDVMLLASNMIDINDIASAKKIVQFLNNLDDLDDVQNIYSNVNIEQNVLEKING
jgi:YebC/PmpR family DNA-binding regulatory protein